MLVQFYKRVLMEGETTVVEKSKHWWSKPKEIRRKIYRYGFVDGICDEQDVDKEIEKSLPSLLANTLGWGKDFSGWQRVVPCEEYLSVGENPTIYSDRIILEYINTWKMDKILKTLTGEQFIRFCKENNKDAKEIISHV